MKRETLSSIFRWVYISCFAAAFFLVVLPPFIGGVKQLSYRFWYEDFVLGTVKKVVRPMCILPVKKGE